jgi:hypothetical protein
MAVPSWDATWAVFTNSEAFAKPKAASSPRGHREENEYNGIKRRRTDKKRMGKSFFDPPKM